MAFSFKNIFKTLAQSSASSSRVVGIDIGSAAIKVVELENTSRAVTLRTYGELQLGPYARRELGEAVSLSEDKKIESLVDVVREANVQATHGVLAMPLASSFVTVVPLKLEPGEDLTAKIPVEAKKYIPIPLSEVSLDWAEVTQRSNVDVDTKEVLLVAVQNEALGMYNSLMSSVKLFSQPSEIEVFSTLRALRSSNDGAQAVIDLGARVSKLYIAHSGLLERIHRVSVGGTQITKRIAQLLELEFGEAENLKRNYTTDLPQAADVKKATTVTLEPVLQEFKRIIDQYESRTGQVISTVQLTGGVSATPDLSAFAQDGLGRPVAVANPFSQVAYPAFMEDTLAKIGPTFSASLGAALRSFE